MGGNGQPPPVQTWLPYVDGRIHAHEIACTHQEMTDPDHAEQIGAIITTALLASRWDSKEFARCRSGQQATGWAPVLRVDIVRLLGTHYVCGCRKDLQDRRAPVA